MILSYKNKFIFIKNTKVAGTSIEIALSSICGEEDIITPVSKKDELVRLEQFNSRCMNYAHEPNSETDYVKKLKEVINESDLKQKSEMLHKANFPTQAECKFYNHMYLDTVFSSLNISDKQKFPFSDYLLVYICRDPYSQILSYAEFALMDYDKFLTNSPYEESDIKKKLKSNLDKYIKATKENISRVQSTKLVAEMASFVLRYENLENDFNELLRKLNQPPIELPHAKKSKRKKDVDLHYYLSPEQIKKINRELVDYFIFYDYPMVKV